MKNKNPLIILLGSLLALGGAGVVVNNYTEDDVVLVIPCITEDGRLSQDTIFVAESKEILKHSTKQYGKRSLTDSLIIVIHHSATSKYATAYDIARIHVVDNDWPATGYHWGINYKGDYDILNSLETLSYHVRGSNTISIGILCKGNYEIDTPTEEMLVSLENLIISIKSLYDIKRVTIHKDMPRAATKCPGKHLEKALKERKIISLNFSQYPLLQGLPLLTKFKMVA